MPALVHQLLVQLCSWAVSHRSSACTVETEDLCTHKYSHCSVGQRRREAGLKQQDRLLWVLRGA